MWPGVPGSVSGTLLGRISTSSNTTPGVLALTLSPSAGLPRPSRRVDASRRAERRNRQAGGLVERDEEVAVGDEHAVGVHGHAAMPEARARGGAAARVVLPDLLAGHSVHRHHLHGGRGDVEHAIDHHRIALHLGGREVVAALVGPGHLELRHVVLGDLGERREASVARTAIDGPVGRCGGAGAQAGEQGEEQTGGSEAGRHAGIILGRVTSPGCSAR